MVSNEDVNGSSLANKVFSPDLLVIFHALKQGKVMVTALIMLHNLAEPLSRLLSAKGRLSKLAGCLETNNLTRMRENRRVAMVANDAHCKGEGSRN